LDVLLRQESAKAFWRNNFGITQDLIPLEAFLEKLRAQFEVAMKEFNEEDLKHLLFFIGIIHRFLVFCFAYFGP
jgi:hypothetical protein